MGLTDWGKSLFPAPTSRDDGQIKSWLNKQTKQTKTEAEIQHKDFYVRRLQHSRIILQWIQRTVLSKLFCNSSMCSSCLSKMSFQVYTKYLHCEFLFWNYSGNLLIHYSQTFFYTWGIYSSHHEKIKEIFKINQTSYHLNMRLNQSPITATHIILVPTTWLSWNQRGK